MCLTVLAFDWAVTSAWGDLRQIPMLELILPLSGIVTLVAGVIFMGVRTPLKGSLWICGLIYGFTLMWSLLMPRMIR